jgi:hypothetical protein
MKTAIFLLFLLSMLGFALSMGALALGMSGINAAWLLPWTGGLLIAPAAPMFVGMAIDVWLEY